MEVRAIPSDEVQLTGLQTTLQEVLGLEGKHIIELHARLVEHADTHQTANQGVALEEALGILFVEGEKLTAGSDVSTWPCV